jgi:hypothetical protein
METDQDGDLLERALERRLRERALRADSGVRMTPETIERWIREELHSLFREISMFRDLKARSRAAS